MLIVGLGNPGTDYETTRHNIGFMVVDELNYRLDSINVTKTAFLGNCYKSKNHFLLQPLTFMNLSGESVLKVKNFYKQERRKKRRRKKKKKKENKKKKEQK